MDWLDDPQGFESNYNSQGGNPMFYQWYYPKANKIKPQQAAYIENWMDEFEEALFANNYTNSLGNRYSDYINLNSFTDFLLINEFSKNSDGYKLSSYVHKDADSKGGNMQDRFGTLIRPTVFLCLLKPYSNRLDLFTKSDCWD